MYTTEDLLSEMEDALLEMKKVQKSIEIRAREEGMDPYTLTRPDGRPIMMDVVLAKASFLPHLYEIRLSEERRDSSHIVMSDLSQRVHRYFEGESNG